MTLDEFLKEWYNDDDRLLVHTSGSTGKPKPLWVEKRRMEASASITCSFLGLKPGDTALLCMPLDYIAGKMMVVRSIVCGLRLICVEPTGHPLDASLIDNGKLIIDNCHTACSLPANYQLSIIKSQLGEAALPHGNYQLSIINYQLGEADAIGFAAMVPMQVYNSLQVPEERERLMSIRHLIIGGGAIDDALAAELRTFPNAVWSTYGMTETLSHIALRRLNGPEASDWYMPFDTVNVSLSADGCLVIDAPAVCDRPLTTNDRAEIAPDGRRFRIIGRKDNVICSGGVKIQIEEVERALRPHLSFPFIITKRHDPKFGEAVVMLMQSSDAAVAQTICRRVLPRYWQPQYYVTVATIPTTETGKPARKEAEIMAATAI